MRRINMAYNTAAQSMRERILSGEWQAGLRLKPERDLCVELGISRITIRHALRILEEEGLLTRQQGRGTFVNAHPSRRIPIINGDFSASIMRHAPELRRVLKLRQYQPAGGEYAVLLGVQSGDRVLFARRTDLLGAVVTAVDEVVIPAVFADLLQEKDLESLDFLECLAVKHKLPLDYETQTIEGMPAGAPVSEFLEVESGAPLLKETNVVYLTGGRPVVLFVSYYRCEYYQFKSVSRIAERINNNGGLPDFAVKVKSDTGH